MIVEDCKACPPRAVPTMGKGKGKAIVVPKPFMSMEEALSPLSLEALIADSTLFEEPLLKDPEEEVIVGLASLYG